MSNKSFFRTPRFALIVLATIAPCIATAAESGFYLGAGGGEATNKADELDFNASDTAFKLFAGYSFNKYFATELAYIDAGSPSERIGNTTVEISASGFLVSGVGRVPLGDKFSLFGKLGYAFYDSKASLRIGASTISDKNSDEDLAYGIGAALDFGSRFGLRAEYEAVDVSDGEFSIVSLSGVFRF